MTYLVGHLDQLGRRTDGGTRHDAAVLENLSGLDDNDVELAVGLVLGVVPLHDPLAKSTRRPTLGERCHSPSTPSTTPRGTYVDEINREHGQMLVEEVDAPLVDTLGDGLSDLVRAPALNHVEAGPPVLRLGARRRADEERVAELALEVVLLDVVGEEGGDFPGEKLALRPNWLLGRYGGTGEGDRERRPRAEPPGENLLGVADAREAGPADVRAIGEVVQHVLRLAHLVEHRRPLDAGLERGGRARRGRHVCGFRVGFAWKSGELAKCRMRDEEDKHQRSPAQSWGKEKRGRK